jgi:hypothetical protein
MGISDSFCDRSSAARLDPIKNLRVNNASLTATLYVSHVRCQPWCSDPIFSSFSSFAGRMQYNSRIHTQWFITFAFKEVAILLFCDAGVQTTLGDYLVLDAPSSVLPESIVNTPCFVVLKAGFKISIIWVWDRNVFVLLPLKSYES